MYGDIRFIKLYKVFKALRLFSNLKQIINVSNQNKILN